MPEQHSVEDLPLFEYAKEQTLRQAQGKEKEPKKKVIETSGGKRGKITITETATSQTWDGLHPQDDVGDTWKDK